MDCGEEEMTEEKQERTPEQAEEYVRLAAIQFLGKSEDPVMVQAAALVEMLVNNIGSSSLMALHGMHTQLDKMVQDLGRDMALRLREVHQYRRALAG